MEKKRQEGANGGQEQPTPTFEMLIEEQRQLIRQKENDAMVKKITALANQFLESTISIPETKVKDAQKTIDNLLPNAELEENIPLLTALARLKVALDTIVVETEEQVLRRYGNGSREYPHTGRGLDFNAHNAARDGGESFLYHNGVTIRVVGNEKKVSLANPENEGDSYQMQMLEAAAEILGFDIE